MALIDRQRTLARQGVLRLGRRVPTGGVDRAGRPKMRPVKLDTWRATSPFRASVEAIANIYGGDVVAWPGGPSGPEWEAITPVRKIAVLVPPQTVEPWYEKWGNKLRERVCDGATERLRVTPCLCEGWNNHEHLWHGKKCQLCGLAQTWEGPEHTHRYINGECETCGCRRACKPTTRLNVIPIGAPLGMWKVESHGFTAADELPALAGMIHDTPVPLEARLTAREVKFQKLIFENGQQRVESREYYVPGLVFDWLDSAVAYGGMELLGRVAQRRLEALRPADTVAAIGATAEPAAPEEDATPLTAEVALRRVAECANIPQVQHLWREVAAAKVGTPEISAALNRRAAELTPTRTPQDEGDDTVDAEIIEEVVRG